MKSRKALALAVFCLFTTGAVFAKLPSPPLSDEQKAKAEEARGNAAGAAKMEAEQLAKAQDRVADGYIKAQKAKGITVKPTPIVSAPALAAAAAPAKK
jgi:uncharacterized protein YggE